MTDPSEFYATVRDEFHQVVIGQDSVLEGLTIALLTHGHVLLEGIPGIGKTTIADVFAQASGLEYNRVQMTPDLLPADITGSEVYEEGTGEFSLRRGPVFTNIVVADEINRASPKTQSALLEAMEEGKVTIAGETLSLPTPFLLVATQNPVEKEGTFELPAAQRDRFRLKVAVNIPDFDGEKAILDRFDTDPQLDSGTIEQVVDQSDITEARGAVESVYVDDRVKRYILRLIGEVRDAPEVEYDVSPRASLAFLHCGKAKAAIEGRDYVIPDDVNSLAYPVLRHRIVLGTDAELRGVTPFNVIDKAVADVDPPAVEAHDGRSTVLTGDDNPASSS